MSQKFRYKTVNYTRNSLQAQQIYHEWVKLKKYFKVRSLTGKELVPQVKFHRVQVPTINRHVAVDMEKFYYETNPYPKWPYWFCSFAVFFTLGYYVMRLEFDQDTRYYYAVYYTRFFMHYSAVSSIIKDVSKKLIERAGIDSDTDLTGEAGKYNIIQGLKRIIWKQDEEKLKLQTKELEASTESQKFV